MTVREYGDWRDVVDAVPIQGQRQDSVTDQLKTLLRVSIRLGCYDASDWILDHMIGRDAHRSERGD